MDDFLAGYVAGLIIGEGCFTGRELRVKLHADDPEPLEWLREALGGTIYGPYEGRTCRYRVWVLRGEPLRRLLPWLQLHLPPSRKRRQFWQWYFSRKEGQQHKEGR